MRQQRFSQPGTVRGKRSPTATTSTRWDEGQGASWVDDLRPIERGQVYRFAGMVAQDGQRRLGNLAQVAVAQERLSRVNAERPSR
jgi:hypothetical protein